MPSILSLLIFIYIGFISVHLFCCFFAMENPRMLTKIFLMPFLSLIYYKATPKEKFSKSIFAAIIFGFLGDVILLGDNLKEGFERGDILIPGICYISLLAITNITSGIYAYTYFNVYAILVHFGTFIFTISDFILARKMFYENKQYYQVILMATYILAQTLICFGMSNKKNKIEGEKKKIL